MNTSSKYILASIPGIVAFVLEFFSKELLTGGLSQNSFFVITKILWGITLVGYGVIYLKTRNKK